VDEPGLGLCSVAGFLISSIEPSGSAARELVSKVDHREMFCGGGTGLEVCPMAYFGISSSPVSEPVSQI
jgi:hypothetical protein